MGTKGEWRRNLFIQAALEHSSRNGYGGATTRTNAESTGVTEATLFRHFPAKHALFLAVVDECGPNAPKLKASASFPHGLRAATTAASVPQHPY